MKIHLTVYNGKYFFFTKSFVQQSDSLVPEAIDVETKLSLGDIPVLKEAFIDIAPDDRNKIIS